MDALWVSLANDHALVKMLLALVLGGLIGIEREWHGRAAGLRTHVLVCLGSVILVVGARAASLALGSGLVAGSVVLDPNRISAGIVTGIGFLGAGAILRTGDLIRGLTTAACIWFVAALGIVIGQGQYALAGFATLAGLLVLILLDAIEHHIPPVIYRTLSVSMDLSRWEALELECGGLLRRSGIRIQETLRRVNTSTGRVEIVFQIRTRGDVKTRPLIETISAMDGVHRVQWDQS